MKPILALLVTLYAASSGLAQPKVVPVVGFTYLSNNGSLPPPHQRSRELTGKVRTGAIDLVLVTTKAGKKAIWKGTLRGDAYRRCILMLRATRMKPAPKVPMVGGPQNRVSLAYVGGHTVSGTPVNLAEWRAFLASVEKMAGQPADRR